MNENKPDTDPIASIPPLTRASGRSSVHWVGVGLAVVGLGIFLSAATTVLGLFGIGGNQIEHANVAFDLKPDGSGIVFSSANGGLFTYDFLTKKATELNRSKEILTAPKYSPDGKSIVYVAWNPTDRRGEICEEPAAGGKAVRLTHGSGTSDSEPAFSPDGKQIVFIRAARYRAYSMGGMVWDDFDICLLDVASGNVTTLTHEKYYSASSPTFTDGGRAIVYSASAHGESAQTSAFSISVGSGSVPTAIMPRTGSSQQIGSWVSDIASLSDGNRLVFISDRAEPFAYDIYTSDSNGKNPKALGFTSISHYNRAPIFAKDGKSIYVLAGTESNAHSRPIFSFYQVDLSGRATPICDSGLFTDPLAWRPK
ncbi:MAG: hypothetical protein P4L46_16600 [Fimbriimonas sp.]|nr:hypothetical protein [Fimbriimonas sp.]